MLAYVTHNLGPRNRDPRGNVSRVLRTTGEPVALCLQEATEVRHVKVAGYRLVTADDDPHPDWHDARVPVRDRLSSVVFLRDDVEILKVEARQVPDAGWTWNGNPRVGRVWVRVVYRLDGVVSEVWSVHRCPQGPAPYIDENEAAWAAEHRFLVAWVTRVLEHNPGRHIEIGGDHNTWLRKAPRHRYSLEALCRELGAVANTRHIDGFLSINAPTTAAARPRRALVPNVHKLVRKFGSDGHRPVVLRYVPRGRATA